MKNHEDEHSQDIYIVDHIYGNIEVCKMSSCHWLFSCIKEHNDFILFSDWSADLQQYMMNAELTGGSTESLLSFAFCGWIEIQKIYSIISIYIVLSYLLYLMSVLY